MSVKEQKLRNTSYLSVFKQNNSRKLNFIYFFTIKILFLQLKLIQPTQLCYIFLKNTLHLLFLNLQLIYSIIFAKSTQLNNIIYRIINMIMQFY